VDLSKLGLTFRTALNLKPSQISWRILREFQRKFPFNGSHLKSVSVGPSQLKAHWSQTLLPLYQLKNFDLKSYLNGTHNYIGESRNFKNFPDWNKVIGAPLWTYELHYFKEFPSLADAYLKSKNPEILEKIKILTKNWIEHANSTGTGWDPYPVSTRVLNWILIHHLLEPEFSQDSNFIQQFQKSLVAQLIFLSSRLEFHLLGNHLFRNATALIIGGLFLNNKIGNNLKYKGLKIYSSELHEQILGDGAHFERSPLYHLLVLRDLLSVIAALNCAQEKVPPIFLEKLRQMDSFLTKIRFRQESLPLFNDSVRQPEFSIEAIQQMSQKVLKSVPLDKGQQEKGQTSGYFIFDNSLDRETLIVDAGSPGPAYLQGHAHCDLLSFEYSFQGIPVIVDSGVHGYKGSPFREYSRSTRAHNTLMINGLEQFEIWDAFRVARQPKRIQGGVTLKDGSWQFVGSYSPYHQPKWKHQRTIKCIQHGEWLIMDQVHAQRGCSIESYLHFHPDWELKIEANKIIGQNKLLNFELIPINLSLPTLIKEEKEPIQGWYFPSFGVALPSTTLVFKNEVKPFNDFGYQFKIFHE